jgi:hypothetical protein
MYFYIYILLYRTSEQQLQLNETLANTLAAVNRHSFASTNVQSSDRTCPNRVQSSATELSTDAPAIDSVKKHKYIKAPLPVRPVRPSLANARLRAVSEPSIGDPDSTIGCDDDEPSTRNKMASTVDVSNNRSSFDLHKNRSVGDLHAKSAEMQEKRGTLKVRSHLEMNEDGTVYVQDSDWEMTSESEQWQRSDQFSSISSAEAHEMPSDCQLQLRSQFSNCAPLGFPIQMSRSATLDVRVANSLAHDDTDDEQRRCTLKPNALFDLNRTDSSRTLRPTADDTDRADDELHLADDELEESGDFRTVQCLKSTATDGQTLRAMYRLEMDENDDDDEEEPDDGERPVQTTDLRLNSIDSMCDPQLDSLESDEYADIAIRSSDVQKDAAILVQGDDEDEVSDSNEAYRTGCSLENLFSLETIAEEEEEESLRSLGGRMSSLTLANRRCTPDRSTFGSDGAKLTIKSTESDQNRQLIVTTNRWMQSFAQTPILDPDDCERIDREANVLDDKLTELARKQSESSDELPNELLVQTLRQSLLSSCSNDCSSNSSQSSQVTPSDECGSLSNSSALDARSILSSSVISDSSGSISASSSGVESCAGSEREYQLRANQRTAYDKAHDLRSSESTPSPLPDDRLTVNERPTSASFRCTLRSGVSSAFKRPRPMSCDSVGRLWMAPEQLTRVKQEMISRSNERLTRFGLDKNYEFLDFRNVYRTQLAGQLRPKRAHSHMHLNRSESLTAYDTDLLLPCNTIRDASRYSTGTRLRRRVSLDRDSYSNSSAGSTIDSFDRFRVITNRLRDSTVGSGGGSEGSASPGSEYIELPSRCGSSFDEEDHDYDELDERPYLLNDPRSSSSPAPPLVASYKALFERST